MKKRFHHLGLEWEASTGDVSAPLASRRVTFRSKWGEFGSLVHAPDPAGLSEEELRASLDQELERRIIAAINKSRYTWRPAEAIGTKETSIPADHVRRILETTTAADIIRAPQSNRQGGNLGKISTKRRGDEH